MITDTSTTHGFPPYVSLSDTYDNNHILCIRSDMQVTVVDAMFHT